MIKINSLGDLLRQHGLKKTDIRVEIIELFMTCDYALSVHDVVSKLKTKKDRVTIYRALISFEKRGILHRASEDGQGVKYAMNLVDNKDKLTTKKHVHFVCDECNKTYCLSNLSVPDVEIPNEYLVNQVYYSINGICQKCQCR
ncbi:MAG: transcriptional repressor [Fulvivirga sp.]